MMYFIRLLLLLTIVLPLSLFMYRLASPVLLWGLIVFPNLHSAAECVAGLIGKKYRLLHFGVLAGYALAVPFLLQIVTGLLPDFTIMAFLLQFYIVYVIWEGVPVMTKVPDSQRLQYTLVCTVLLTVCPWLIRYVFFKLTVLLN